MTTLRLRYVHSFVDKTNRVRHYFRFRGKRWPLPGQPGTTEFADAYTEAKRAMDAGAAPRRTLTNLVYGPKSLGHVIDRYFASEEFARTSPGTKRRYRAILERLKQAAGGGLITDLRERHVRELRKLFASNSTADFAVMLLRILWTFAKEELAIDLGVNPAAKSANCIGTKSHSNLGLRNLFNDSRRKPDHSQRHGSRCCCCCIPANGFLTWRECSGATMTAPAS
jgi:hypothetical protein